MVKVLVVVLGMLFMLFLVISWNIMLICLEFCMLKRGYNGFDSLEIMRFLKWNMILLDLVFIII